MTSQTHRYEFRVEGNLSTRWRTWFEGLVIRYPNARETVMTGPITDQAALHGVLIKIRDLGLPLVTVSRLPEEDAGTLEIQISEERSKTMTRDEAIAYIKDVEFGYLATIGADKAPRVRPVGIKDIYGEAVYFFTFRNTRKVAEITASPEVEVVWSKPGTLSQVRMRGSLAEEMDPTVQAQFKTDNPMVAKLLPPGAEGLFMLYKLIPQTVEMAKTLGPYEVVSW